MDGTKKRPGWPLLVLMTAFFLVAMTAVAVADTLAYDADLVMVGNQSSLDLGTVSPGAVLTRGISFQLVCAGKNHVDYNQVVNLNFSLAQSTVPAGGALSATNASIGPIPLNWPDDTTGGGTTNCPTTPPVLDDNGNSTVTITAPTAPGSYTYVAYFANVLSPAGAGDPQAITGSTPAATFSLIVEAPADTTPPVITPTVTGTLGNGGWYVSNVTVSWSVVDNESAIVSSSGCDSTAITADTSGTTLTCSATSTGGTSSESVTIKRDATAPTISASLVPPAPGASGWYNIGTGAPTVSYTCGDAMSGLSGSCPSPYTFGEGASLSHSETVFDVAGNGATADVTGISVDLTAPSINASISPARPASGWWNIASGAPTVTFTCSADVTCPAPYTFGEGANQSYSQTVFDLAGNSATAGVSDVDVDLTAPTVSASLDKSPAGTGWFNLATGAPTVSFTCSDATSGVVTCPGSYTFPEGEDQSYSQTIFDNAGNSASAGVSDIDVDLTAPSISASVSPDRPASGWWNIASGAPTVSFTCSDALSGLAGACPADHLFGEGANQSYSQTIYDNAGNSASAGVDDIDVDLTAPTTAVTGVIATTYILGSVPSAGCSTSDNLSGVASGGNLTVSGGSVNGVGDFTATCSAPTDVAGNIGVAASVTYHVNYGSLSGILQPINPDNTSIFKRGQAVPVKFRLAGDEFFGFTTSGWHIWRQQVSCTAFDGADGALDPVPSNTPSTVFRYDPSADQYIYNADMKNLAVGSCWNFKVMLDSGQVLYSAVFKLAK